jgi:hypothetical protein
LVKEEGTVRKRRQILKRNVGGADKVFRFLIGLVLVVVGVFAPISHGWKIVALVVAAIAVITAFTGF